MDDDPLMPVNFSPCKAKTCRQKLALRAAVFEEALQQIATPKRADGTYNLCREACELLAQKALQQGMQYEEDQSS